MRVVLLWFVLHRYWFVCLTPIIMSIRKASPMMRVLASEIAGKVDAVQVHVPDNAKGDDAKEETHRLAALQNERERVTW